MQMRLYSAQGTIMVTIMLLLLLSCAAGALTVLAPCVLPILPVIVGGAIASSSKERLRPYLISAALAASIIAFTLLLKVSTWLIQLSPIVLTALSGGLLMALGCVSIFPELWEKLMVELNWQAASQRLLGRGERNTGQYIGPILVGIALGPVFASCSPTYAFILASVLPHNFITGLLYLIAYSLGLVATLLLVALAGRRYLRRFTWAIDTHSQFRRGIGVIFVLIGVVIASGNLGKLELLAANHLPFDEARLELRLLPHRRQAISAPLSNGRSSTASTDTTVLNVPPTPAPEFLGLSDWINSPPLHVAQLRGKVVLVDFWTYSCINCIRTLPYIEQWYNAYRQNGFVVVGVSTPEFSFEHSSANVQAAVKKEGISYPVALDNNYDTWNAYNNSSWPADYLIDQNGTIRYISLGEGGYDKTEKAIQLLLGQSHQLQTTVSTPPVSQDQTPETYFGLDRRSNFSGNIGTKPNREGSYNYTQPALIPPNTWALKGAWFAQPQFITSASPDATLSFNLTAKDVYMVASISGQQAIATVTLPADAARQYGTDDAGGKLLINASRLYHIASFNQLRTATITIAVPPGVSLYTFTFGS